MGGLAADLHRRHRLDHSDRLTMTKRHIYNLYVWPSWFAVQNRQLLYLVTDLINHAGGCVPCMLCQLQCGPGYSYPGCFVLLQGGDPIATQVSVVCDACDLRYDQAELEYLVFNAVKRDLLPDAIHIQIHQETGHA
jgi:hypothetical protein